MTFSVFQQICIVYSNSIQGTLLCMSSKGLGNQTVISYFCQEISYLWVKAKINSPLGYKPFFMLNSTEHVIFHSHKC